MDTFFLDLAGPGQIISFHLPLQFEVGVVDWSFIADEGFGLVQSFNHLLVLPDYLVASDQSHFMFLELAGGDEVGDIGLAGAVIEFEHGLVAGVIFADLFLGLGVPLGPAFALGGDHFDAHEVVEVLGVVFGLQPELVLLHRILLDRTINILLC